MRPEYAEQLDQDLGKRFGKLVVIEITKERKHRKVVVRCQCDCGGTCFVLMSTLRSGLQTSCGCVKAEIAKANGRLALPIMIERGLWEPDPKIGTAKNVFKSGYSDGNLTFEQFFELSQKPCFYCGEVSSNHFNTYDRKRNSHSYSEDRIINGYFHYNGLDRVDNNKPHNIDNVVPCCCRCNYMKSDQTYDEFIDRVSRIAKNHAIFNVSPE